MTHELTLDRLQAALAHLAARADLERTAIAADETREQLSLPMGTVTFLFTDIAGSTQLWEQHPQAMRLALARHDTLLRQVIGDHGGVVFKTVGDSVYAAFARAPDALLAAIAAQQALQQEAWDLLTPSVRMALHSGAAELREGDYFGPVLNRLARLLALGHGGQILLSRATHDLVVDDLPPETSARRRKWLSGYAMIRDQGHPLLDSSALQEVVAMAGPAPHAISVSPAQLALLERLLRQQSCPQALVRRAKIVLAAAQGQRNEPIARHLDCSPTTVRLWRSRWAASEAILTAAEAEQRQLAAAIATVLADAPRSGAPDTFTAEQIVQILNLACTPPPDANRPVTAWTPRELADEAVKRKIVSAISPRSVGRFLKSGHPAAASLSLLAERQDQNG